MRLPPPVFETPGCTVYWQGRAPLSEAQGLFTPEARLALTVAESREMNVVWRRLLREGKRVEDLPLYRVLSFQVLGTKLLWEFGLTSYKEYQGTNVHRPGWALADPHRKMSNALGFSIVTVTLDRRVLFHHRSQQVGEQGGMWQVTPAGHPHPPDTLEQAVLAELREELGVTRHELVRPVVATGLGVNNTTSKPELSLLAHLTVTATEVMKRPAVDRWEYDRLAHTAWDAGEVTDWALRNTRVSVPHGLMSLILGGAVDFGEAWLRATRRHLSVQEPPAREG